MCKGGIEVRKILGIVILLMAVVTAYSSTVIAENQKNVNVDDSNDVGYLTEPKEITVTKSKGMKSHMNKNARTVSGNLDTLEDFRVKSKSTKSLTLSASAVSSKSLLEDLGIIQLTNIGITGPMYWGAIHPMFSPDGTMIAYMNGSDPSGNRSIWIIKLDFSGGTPKVVAHYPITDPNVHCAHLEDWSPDGTKILYRVKSEKFGEARELWIANVDGSGNYKIFESPGCLGGRESQAQFSPDGSKIVFTVYNSTTNSKEIWVMNADGSDAHQLTNTVDQCELSPRWSPDGSKIVYFRCYQNSTADLMIMNADGSDQMVLAKHVNPVKFEWTPDGQWIVFQEAGRTERGITVHVFENAPEATSDGFINVSVRGDFNSQSEYADVYVEGDYLGRVNPGAGWQCNANWYTVSFPVTKDQINKWNSDGKIEVTVINSPAVGTFCTYNQHMVNISYDGYQASSVKDFSKGTADIFKIKPDGSELTPLTDDYDEYCEHFPVTFPGGVLYTLGHNIQGNNESKAMVMALDGSKKTMVNPWGESWHDVSPDGKWIVFQTFKPNESNGVENLYLVSNPLAKNEPPVIVYHVNPSHALPGERVVFDASDSYDPDGSIAYIEWIFPDGTVPNPIAFKTFSEPGVYNIKLRVVDDDGAESSVSFNYVVGGIAPVAKFTYIPENPKAGEEIVFNASISYDPDGNIVRYEWDFGDGEIASGVVVNHTYTSAGDYKVTLTVTDATGLTNSTSVVIHVAESGSNKMSFDDLVFVLNTILSGGYDSKADVNHDGKVNFSDLVAVLNAILNNP